jgi:hypothetical protein
MTSYPKRTDLSDRDVALIHGGRDLKYVVLSNNDSPITSRQWKGLMELLESKGYFWKDGCVPTFGKVPPTTERNLWVTEKKTLAFAQAGYFLRDFFITLDEFRKMVESE